MIVLLVSSMFPDLLNAWIHFKAWLVGFVVVAASESPITTTILLLLSTITVASSFHLAVSIVSVSLSLSLSRSLYWLVDRSGGVGRSLHYFFLPSLLRVPILSLLVLFPRFFGITALITQSVGLSCLRVVSMVPCGMLLFVLFNFYFTYRRTTIILLQASSSKVRGSSIVTKINNKGPRARGLL